MLHPRTAIRSVFLLFLIILGSVAPAPAQLEVVPVPYRPGDPAVPHPTYAGHPTRMKAIARGGPSTVYYRWDANGDGVWDCDWTYASDVNDLDLSFDYPDSGVNQTHQAVITVSPAPSPDGAVFGSVPVLVLTGFPDPATDPQWAEHADAAQLDILRNVALDDALWYLHGQMQRSGTGTNQIWGFTHTSTNVRDRLTNSALHLLALLDRGYLPAYPPGTYEDLGVTPPAGFIAANDERWYVSPYAEDATRLLNYLLANIGTVISIPAADEADDGTTPISGTNDGYGWAVYDQLTEYSPAVALAVAALANTGLEGTVAQIGTNARGRTLEFVVQQLVDYLAAAQLDENCGPTALGGWYYTPCLDCGWNADYAFSQHFGWAVFALHEAETQMGAAGVHVNQRVKNRLPNMLYYNQYTDGGPRYRNVDTWSMFDPVGHMLLACRWLGWDEFEIGDPTPCGYPSLSIARGEARAVHDAYVAYAESRWTQSGTGQASDPNTVLWQDGNFASGVRGHSWLMPMYEIVHATGDAQMWIGSHDWATEFETDLAYQQRTSSPPAWYDYFVTNHYTNPYLYNQGETALAAALMAELAAGGVTSPPYPPGSFSVAYAAQSNQLQWTESPSLDVLEYRVYRGDDPLVPVDEGHLAATVQGLQWFDPHFGWDAHYRMTCVDWAGNESDAIQPTTITGTPDGEMSARTRLGPAYPNPFNPAVRIPVYLTDDGVVTLTVFDVTGRRVATLLDGAPLPAGRHEVCWNGRDEGGRPTASGSYMFRLRVGEVTSERRAVLVK